MEPDLPRERIDAGASELHRSEVVSQVKTSVKAPLARVRDVRLNQYEWWFDVVLIRLISAT